MGVSLNRVGEFKWVIPVSYKSFMRVPGIIFASESLIEDIKKDESLEQVANAASLPGIVKASFAMPDIHYGYGLPIGGVVATDVDRGGVITPGGVGYDINCGVRLLRTNLKKQDINDPSLLVSLLSFLKKEVPSGVGSEGKVRLTKASIRDVVIDGAKWAIKHGYGNEGDLDFIEANGCLGGVNPDKVSQKAYKRGLHQLGTLGSGNHFLEIQYVDEIFDLEAACKLGLYKDTVTIMIHSGSRGFGHQVCTDYLSEMNKVFPTFNIDVPDRQLVCAPMDSKVGIDYLSAMKAAANFAWANRQCLMGIVEDVFCSFFRVSMEKMGFKLIYDIAHNIVKCETHIVEGDKKRLAVHRKGATRAFPPGHEELPESYKEIGQPILIPGDMGRCSYVLVGTQRAMEESFGSACHGAGRLMSRHKAVKSSAGRSIAKELERKGIYVAAATKSTLKEEMPDAYKDVSEVVEVIHGVGIARKVAKMKPVVVLKG